MSEAFQYIDILILAIIAGIVLLRLRSVLGRRTGHEKTDRSSYNYEQPQQTSFGNVSKIDVIRHAVKKIEYINKEKFDIIFDLDITSPLRLKSDIVNSFKKFKKSSANNLITVCKSKKNPY